jgi:hypothetical protein
LNNMKSRIFWFLVFYSFTSIFIMTMIQ